MAGYINSLPSLTLLLFFLVFIILVGIIARTITRRPSGRLPVHSRMVLTKAERIFHATLVRAAAGAGIPYVFSQVSMGAILEVDGNIKEFDRMPLRSRFDRKIIDFVLADIQTRPVLIVELDDSSHSAEKDRVRDQMTGSAGIPTLRVRGPNMNQNELAQQIKNAMTARR